MYEKLREKYGCQEESDEVQKMAYENQEGAEIETLQIASKDLTEIFNQYENRLPYELLNVLDELEFAILQASKEV